MINNQQRNKNSFTVKIAKEYTAFYEITTDSLKNTIIYNNGVADREITSLPLLAETFTLLGSAYTVKIVYGAGNLFK